MRKAKILLVEDDPEITTLITEYLTQQRYEIDAFHDGAAALEHIKEQGLPHLALVDLELPSGMHGFEFSSKLKSMADVPIIFVTNAKDSETIVRGLREYAEDFVTKPFNIHELEARIEVVIARMPSFDYASEPIIHVDKNLSIDFAHHRVIANKRERALTPTEAMLLHILLRHAGRVVENQALIARVWPGEKAFEDTLRVHMHRLRRKLEFDSHRPHYIRTQRGVGYIFTKRVDNYHVDSDGKG